MATRDNDHHANESSQPVDRGYAWVILLACTFIFGLFVGTLRSFGIYFVEFIQEFKSSSSLTSMITGVMQGCYGISSLFVMSVGLHYMTPRLCCMIGGFLGALGFVLGIVAPNVEFLILSNGVIFGLGFGMLHGPAAYNLNQYFVKRRSFANALLVGGGSLGGLILPPLYRWLLDNLGLRGALLLTGGVLSHCIVGAALLRPVDFYNLPSKERDSESDLELNLKINTSRKDSILAASEPLLYDKTENADIMKPEVPFSSKPTSIQNKLLKNVLSRERAISESGLFQKDKGGTTCTTSSRELHPQYISRLSLVDVYSASVTSLSVVQVEEVQIEPVNDLDGNGCWGLLRTLRALSSIIDLRCLKYPYVRLLLFVYSIGSIGSVYGYVYIIAAAKDKDIDSTKLTFLVSIISVCDFIGRVGCGVIADYDVIKKSHMMALTMCISGAVMNMSALFHSFEHFVVFSVTQGLFAGGMFALVPVLLMETLGIEKFRGATGLNVFVQGISMVSSAPFIGYLRDITGSYTVSMHFMGCCLIIPPCLLMVWERLYMRIGEHNCNSSTGCQDNKAEISLDTDKGKTL